MHGQQNIKIWFLSVRSCHRSRFRSVVPLSASVTEFHIGLTDLMEMLTEDIFRFLAVKS